MNNLGPIVRPNLRALFDTERSSAGVNINCMQIGTIHSYAAGSQSATVQLVNQRVVFNTPMPGSATPPEPTIYPYPLLVDVPVGQLFGGSAYIGMPISPGDTCLVLFNDRDLDPWWTNGTTGGAPNTNRVHSLADGIALVIVRPKTNPIAGLPSDGAHIAIGNASGSLRAALDAFMTATIGAVISGTTFNPATITAMTAAKAQVDAILQ